MLPRGVLAKHGYTTKWGFFSGVCQGSEHRPYETHTDLIERFIEWAEEKRADLESFRATLLERPAEGTTEAWVNVYLPPTFHNKNGYTWRKVPLTLTIHQWLGGDGYTVNIEYPDQDPQRAGRTHRIDFYSQCRNADYTASTNLLDYIQNLNAKYAATVAKEISQVEDYIRWQQRRLADWKLQPLLPL